MAKILLIDNDPTTVSLLTMLLELDGYAVAVCSAVAGVIASVQRESPDLILMDVFLSGGDGLELLREIRADPANARIPVVMTSGMELSEECSRAGADGFLLKPYTPEQLDSVIQTRLNHRRATTPPPGSP
jgi:CheY-like chemotaxis protein